MASDLDEEGTSDGKRAPVIATFKPAIEPSDTMTRMWVSYALIALLFFIIIAAFISLFILNAGPTSDADAILDARRLMQLLNIVFGPVVALVSSVVGFYFGANTARAGVVTGQAGANSSRN